MTTNRINHTNCNHPRTTAARTTCRKARVADATRRDRGWTSPAETMAIFAADRAADLVNEPTIRTRGGNIRKGSIILAEVRGGTPEKYTVLVVEDDIKNGYPGWEADGRWGYADQVIGVISF